MHPVYKCDYCKFMGTEEEVAEHEIHCMENYDRKNCHTCEHKRIECINGKYVYQCSVGIDIPEGKIYEFCKYYERKQKSNFFDQLFGGVI